MGTFKWNYQPEAETGWKEFAKKVLCRERTNGSSRRGENCQNQKATFRSFSCYIFNILKKLNFILNLQRWQQNHRV